MKRRARPAPFARRRLGSWLRDLAHLPIEEWPRHLKMAQDILVDELKLQDETAWDVLQCSVGAAHACAQQIDQRAQEVFQGGHRESLHKIFTRMANCARRMPASPRHALDCEVSTRLRRMPIDSECMETLIETLIAGFGKCPEAKPSLTVLRAVMPGAPSTSILEETDTAGIHREFAEAAIVLQNDYAALPPIDQRGVESALITLVEERGDALDTADVCTTLSDVLASNSKHEISLAAAGIITDYVEALVAIWQRHGLRPGRATRRWDSNYRSKFHRFADLVLTSVVEPWSRRHDADQVEQLARLREAHAELPKDIRGAVRAGLRRTDAEWLVSENHIKEALGPAQKRTPQTP